MVRKLSELPPTMKVEADTIKCVYCARTWRVPPVGELSDLQFEHLVEHGESHRRSRRAHKPQQWRSR